jgi:hypothetical protein
MHGNAQSSPAVPYEPVNWTASWESAGAKGYFHTNQTTEFTWTTAVHGQTGAHKETRTGNADVGFAVKFCSGDSPPTEPGLCGYGGSGPYYVISAQAPQGPRTGNVGYVVGFSAVGCCAGKDATSLSGSGPAAMLVASTGIWATQPPATLSWNLTRNAPPPCSSTETAPVDDMDQIGEADLDPQDDSPDLGSMLQVASTATTPLMAAEDGDSTAPAATLSGAAWAADLQDSRSLDDPHLDANFASNVRAFIAALDGAQLQYRIGSTYRRPETAYLMHWSWLIDEKHQDASSVPSMDGVDIQWWHGDQKSSEQAAAAMRNLFDPKHKLHTAPALNSNHTRGLAIDMSIYRSWCGTIKIQQAEQAGGTERDIDASNVQNLTSNSDIMDVASGYAVQHFCWQVACAHSSYRDDPNHWSVNGH